MEIVVRSWIGRIKESFARERHNYFLWIPVLFGLGILTYFSLSFEPNLLITLWSLVLMVAVCFLLRRKPLFLYPTLVMLIILSGFAIASIRAHLVEAPKIYVEKVYTIEGRLSDIIPLEKGMRLLIQPSMVSGLDPDKTPKFIRIVAKTNLGGAKIGDKVRLKAGLMPPPKPIIPGGYDFGRFAYFEQIGAIGYTVSNLEILEESGGGFSNWLSHFRGKFGERILEVLGPKMGNIATALTIGQYNAIDQKILDDWRASGLTHILSVSGMHLTLVVLVFFFVTRFLLNLNERIALNVDVKKIAALVALLGSLFYLLVSGMQIAAVRSFIMSSLIILAILLDREVLPLRSIAIAALTILLLRPESVLSVSFQMSFAAVLGLLAFYNLYTRYVASLVSKRSVIIRGFAYVIGVAVSSLLAGTATAPFTIYHFNQYSNYSVIANLLAVPLTSFIVMPAVVLSFMSYPVGLEYYPIKLLGLGVDLTNRIAETIAGLDSSMKYVSQISDLGFALIVSGFLWASLFSGKKRILGAFVILIGIIFCPAHKADLIIDGKSKLFLVNTEEGPVFSKARVGDYTKENWLKYYGVDEFHYLDEDEKWKKHAFCDNEGCVIFIKSKKISIVSANFLLKSDCTKSDFVVNLTNVNTTLGNPNGQGDLAVVNSGASSSSNSINSMSKCFDPSYTLQLHDFKANGVYMIFITNDKISLLSSVNKGYNRVWL